MATTIEGLRGPAAQQLVGNALLLDVVARGAGTAERRAPAPRPAAQPRKRPDERLKPWAEATVDSAQGLMRVAERHMPAARPAPLVRYGARWMGGVPGTAMDVIDAATAETPEARNRAVAGGLGSAAGGGIGAAIPFLEPVTIPAGSYAGKRAGELMYDNRRAIGDFSYRTITPYGHSY